MNGVSEARSLSGCVVHVYVWNVSCFLLPLFLAINKRRRQALPGYPLDSLNHTYHHGSAQTRNIPPHRQSSYLIG
jgi:hypothetical protein